jgi:hypothetical protein
MEDPTPFHRAVGDIGCAPSCTHEVLLKLELIFIYRWRTFMRTSDVDEPTETVYQTVNNVTSFLGCLFTWTTRLLAGSCVLLARVHSRYTAIVSQAGARAAVHALAIWYKAPGRTKFIQ